MKRRIRKELLDELLAGYQNPEDLTGPEGLLKKLTGALVERALSAKLTDHLGHDPGESVGSGNTRNGTSPKTLVTDQGEVPIDPRIARARSSRSW
jgi:putative transposase